MEARPSNISITLWPDACRAAWSFTIHAGFAALLLLFSPYSWVWWVAAVLLVLATRCVAVFLQWPSGKAVRQVMHAADGLWFLRCPHGFVHPARLVHVQWHTDNDVVLTFVDNEWRTRRAWVNAHNCREDERLRFLLRLACLAALPGCNHHTPFWYHR